MKIESNLNGVIGRLTRTIGQDIPAAMTRALAPDHWRAAARLEAEQTLLALAQLQQREFIPGFIETLTAGVFGNGFFLSLRSPFAPDIPYHIAPQAQLPGVGTGTFEALQIPPGNDAWQDFFQQMVEWVDTVKDWDEARDGGVKSFDLVAQKADWLAYIMLSPNLSNVRHDPDRMSEQEARDHLMPHIIKFLQAQAPAKTAGPMDADTIDLWLRAVLAAWREMVCARFPEILRRELRGQGGTGNLVQ